MNSYPIIIIGAGPAGVGTAMESLKRGHASQDVLILEKSGEVAHMISRKYPDEKMVLANYKNKTSEASGNLHIRDMTKKAFLTFMQKTVSENKLNIQFHQTVEEIKKLRTGQLMVTTNHDMYLTDAVFVAIGTMASPRTLSASIDKDVAHLVQYDIQEIELPLKNILVVGGGDSASEYAQILINRGHKVTLSYRGKDFNRMIDANREITMKLINLNLLEFLPSTNIQSINCVDGSPSVTFDNLSKPKIFDLVVTALGSDRADNYLSKIGIKIKSEISELFSESSINGVFFVGDVAAGNKGGTINLAFNSGVKAIGEACFSYLDCN